MRLLLLARRRFATENRAASAPQTVLVVEGDVRRPWPGGPRA